MNTRTTFLTASLAFAALCSGVAAQPGGGTPPDLDQQQGPVGVAGTALFDQKAANGEHLVQVEIAYSSVVHGIRYLAADVRRSATPAGPAWLGMASGTTGTFTIARGDLLTEVDVHQAATGAIHAVTLRSLEGQTETFGSVPQSGATMTTLALTEHEIVGFHGTTDANGLTSLGAHLRGAWEQMVEPVQEYRRLGTKRVVGRDQQIAAIEVSTIDPFRGGNIQGIRYRIRDSRGADLGWTPWHGTATAFSQTLDIAPDDRLIEATVWEDRTFQIVTGLELVTANGASFRTPRLGQASWVHRVDPGHEIVGHYADISGTTSRFFAAGMIQRPITARSWAVGAGCNSAGGAVPDLNLVDLPRVAGGLSLEVIGAPNAIGAITLADQASSMPLLACNLHVSPAIHVPFVMPATGQFQADVAFGSALDYGWDLAGATLYTQAMLLDLTSAPEFSVTDAVGTMFGGI